MIVNTLTSGPILTALSKVLLSPDGSASELQTGLQAQTRAEARLGPVNVKANAALPSHAETTKDDFFTKRKQATQQAIKRTRTNVNQPIQSHRWVTMTDKERNAKANSKQFAAQCLLYIWTLKIRNITESATPSEERSENWNMLVSSGCKGALLHSHRVF